MQQTCAMHNTAPRMPDQPPSPWRFCVAPMMACTDRHYRQFARLLSRHARLYTEMVVAAAILRLKRRSAAEFYEDPYIPNPWVYRVLLEVASGRGDYQ